mgnify:CR=1 FL=1
MIPYILMAFLYLLAAALMALQASFTSFNISPWFNGMVWLRVHLITLGMLTQIMYGALPILTAKHYGISRPTMRWDIWATLNIGLVLLLIGIPLVNSLPIIAGGTLIFISTILLIVQLSKMRAASKQKRVASAGRKFYIAGLLYFLIGILVGTGLFTGWAKPLGIVGNAKEVHIHANNWGLMSLIFAGLIVDLYPSWTKRPLANPRSITPIFWMMTIGAFGLVFGPWFNSRQLLVPGLILHLIATTWLLVNAIQPLWVYPSARSIGIVHIITSYFWILAPIFAAPFILLGIGNLPGATIEGTAPQALVYGWLLQFSIGIVPYFFQRFLFNDEFAQLGGTKLSFVMVNLGSIFLWVSIFMEPSRSILQGTAYLLWAIALLAVAIDLWQKIQMGLARIETAV